MKLREHIRQTLFEISIQELPMYQKSLKFADYVHRNQYRKSSGDKYITHPIAVSMILDQWGYDTQFQTIAVLHDTIEDATNPEVVGKLIKKYFGDSIYKIIKLLSHSKGVEYNEYLLNLYNTDKKAFVIKMADMYSNLNDNPTQKQFDKYKRAIMYLIENDCKIPKQITNKLKI